MLTTQEQYAELLALTQLHLLQEFALTEWVEADPKTQAFFQADIKKQAIPVPVAPVHIAKETIPVPVKPAAPPPVKTKAQTPIQKVPEAKPVVEVPPKQEQKQVLWEELKTPPQEYNLNETKRILKEKYPGQAIIEEIPNDAEAKRISSSWKQADLITDVVILSFDTNPKHCELLENVAKALVKYHVPAQVCMADKFESQSTWSELLKTKHLRLVIANGSGVHGMAGLMKHYREVAKTGKCYLDQVPLYLLPDLSLYWKEPHLKMELWKALRQILNI